VRLDEATKQGVTYLVGDNGSLGDTGASLQPTIVTNVRPSDRLYDEETFGPSASLSVVENEAEAVKLANESSYGPNAAVHSKDVFSALRVARELEYGQADVKGSGGGRNNGRLGRREFLVEKMVSVPEPAAALHFG
jgi:acyl-CoA reductase-like NAD-dependent aldehyde dehydrogenase